MSRNSEKKINKYVCMCVRRCQRDNLVSYIALDFANLAVVYLFLPLETSNSEKWGKLKILGFTFKLVLGSELSEHSRSFDHHDMSQNRFSNDRCCHQAFFPKPYILAQSLLKIDGQGDWRASTAKRLPPSEGARSTCHLGYWTPGWPEFFLSWLGLFLPLLTARQL